MCRGVVLRVVGCGIVPVVCCVVLFLSCGVLVVCLCDLLNFLQKQRNTTLTLAHARTIRVAHNPVASFSTCSHKRINRSHTHTHRQRTPPTPTHTHDKNNTPNPKTSTSHKTLHNARRWCDDGACHLPQPGGWPRRKVSVGGRVEVRPPSSPLVEAVFLCFC